MGDHPRQMMTGSLSKSPAVALVVPNLAGHGAQLAALNLAAALGDDRAVVVAETRAGELLRHPAAERTRFAGLEPAGRLQRIHRLTAALRELAPEIVVSQLSPVVTSIAARVTDTPVIHWLQNPPLSDRPAGRRAGVALLRCLLQRDAVLAAASPGLLRQMAGLGFPDERLALLPNPIQATGLHRQPLRPAWHTPARLISVGRLAKQKRPDLLLEAVRTLLDERPVELHLVGAGPLEAELRDQAHRLGIENKVHFHGFVHDPSRLVADADVFVLASDYEGFGNVLVEALATGIPVVATDAPYGARFILDEGRFGELVAVGSGAAIAAGVATVLSRGPIDAARTRMLQERADLFSPGRVAQRFNDICELVRRGTPSPVDLRDW